MKTRKTGIRGLLLVALLGGGGRAAAQVEIITTIVSKVVRAADLVVQRLQTETIVLQEAEQELQNLMSQTRLDEIANWVDDQRSLYAEYFQELKEVKDVISGYHKVAEIVQREEQIVAAYQRGLAAIRQDKHFTAGELGQIEAVYGGILAESGKNLVALTNVLESLATQMSDEQRLAIIDQTSAGMDKNYLDLQAYTNQNALLSLQRAKDEHDVAVIKQLYGL
jgi:hypothetical protein